MEEGGGGVPFCGSVGEGARRTTVATVRRGGSGGGSKFFEWRWCLVVGRWTHGHRKSRRRGCALGRSAKGGEGEIDGAHGGC
jgi:hypothetical protein